MKRLGYSILIGAGCAFIFLGISKLQENKRKTKGGFSDRIEKRSSPKGYYSAEMQVAIGNPGDSGTLIELTKDQILYRLNGPYTNLSFEKIDKNIYLLKANKILDTSAFKNAITASGKIEFSELFTLPEISESLTTIDSILHKRDLAFLTKQKKIQKANKSLDTATDKLSDILEHGELETSRDPGLRKFILFSSPYQNSDGSLRYTAELGYVKITDTSSLNELLNDPEFTRLFPENLNMIYGSMDGDLYTNDSMLKLFAKKNLERTYFPYPTGDQITNASPAFEPLTGNPMIEMSFSAGGASAWQLMTERNVNRPIAIMADDIVLSAPFVESAIEGGESRITGSFSADETAVLCKMILSGELPLTTRITTAAFKYHSSKKIGRTLIILILFVLSTAATYGISFLIKPASKP